MKLILGAMRIFVVAFIRFYQREYLTYICDFHIIVTLFRIRCLSKADTEQRR